MAIIHEWCDGTGFLNLTMTTEQAEQGYHSGQCDSSIAELRKDAQLAAQLDALDMMQVTRYLMECGIDVADMSDDLKRAYVLWMACGDIVDDAYAPDEDDAEHCDKCGEPLEASQIGLCDNCSIPSINSCCASEQRNINGGCDNCGAPCL